MSATLPFKDFTGGITENYLSAPPNRYKTADNFIITTDGWLQVRSGSDFLSAGAPRPVGNARISAFITLSDGSYYINTGRKLYSITSGVATELVGPGGSSYPVLSAGASTDHISWSEWRGHAFITNDAGAKVVKVYKDETNTRQVRTAGLPAIADSANYTPSTETFNLATLANELRTVFLAHLSGEHDTADTESAALVGAAASTSSLSAIITLISQLQIAYLNHFADTESGRKWHRRDNYYFGANPANYAHVTVAQQTLSITLAPTDHATCALALNDLVKCCSAHFFHIPIHSSAAGWANPTLLPNPIDTGPAIRVSMTPVYDLANRLKAQYNAHLNRLYSLGLTNGHAAADVTNVVTSANASTWKTLIGLCYEFWADYKAHNADADLGAGWAYHYAQAATTHEIVPFNILATGTPFNLNPDLLGTFAWLDLDAIVAFLNEATAKYTAHVFDTGAGGANPHQNNIGAYPDNAIPVSALSLAEYGYAFVHYSTYTVGTNVFEDFGPPLFKNSNRMVAIEQYPASITNIPVLSNGSTDNYATSTIKIKIYRTENGGSVYYYIGEVTNGTTTFTDRITDAQLVSNPRLYTTGGIPDNDPPPLAKCLHIVDNTCYYGNITDGGISYPRRVSQSVPDDPDSVPGDFFDDMDDNVVAISSHKSVRIVLCENSCYRLEGGFDTEGRGALTHVAISTSIGCVGMSSVVQVPGGVCFAGNDGFYFTDGYSLMALSDFRTTYAGLVSTTTKAKNIYGCYDKYQNAIFWAVQASTGSSDNDTLYVLNLNAGGLKSPSAFTTWSGGDSFSPTALALITTTFARGDRRGYAFAHLSSIYYDLEVDTSISTSLWNTQVITYNFVSAATDFGDALLRKWVTDLSLTVKGDTNQSISITSINDDGRTSRDLAPVRFRGNIAFGDPEVDFGDEILFSPTGLVTVKRRFPRGTQRCSRKQIQITNASVITASSDGQGEVLIDSTANTATLTTTQSSWPSDCVGGFLLLSHDGYGREFEVSALSGDTITFLDPDNACPPDGMYAWVFKTTPRDERLSLIDYALHYLAPSDSKSAFSDTGENE